MARHRDRRRVGKEQLALAVRKDFNAATMIEGDIVPKFLYTVHNQGNSAIIRIEPSYGLLIQLPDKNFRMRFEPSQGK